MDNELSRFTIQSIVIRNAWLLILYLDLSLNRVFTQRIGIYEQELIRLQED